MSRFACHLALIAALVVLVAACSDDSDTFETDATEIDGGDDVGDDVEGSADVADEVWSPPVYEPVACEAREASAGAATIRPPACEYDVTYPVGMVDIIESCQLADDATAPTGLHLTFPTEDAGTAVAALWTTPNTTRESLVRVGTAPDALDTIYWGYNFTYGGLTGRLVHEVHLCGLEPGRTYYYQAGAEGAWSDVHMFATAPAAGVDDEVVFAIAGDSRSDTFEVWGDIVQQARDLGAEFFVFSGDAVEAGPAQSEWDLFFEQGQPGLAEMPIIPANGNHDLLLSTWYGQFALGNDEINAGIRYGDLAIAAMTDFYIPDVTAVFGPFADFLDDFYSRNSDAGWKFLTNHRAFYSASNHGSMDDLQRAWSGILDDHAVDIVFNGHDHNYERSHPIRDGAVAEWGEGTVYTVIAGAGAPSYSNGSDWWTDNSESTNVFAIVRVQGGTLQFTAYRTDGTTLDEFTLQH